MICILQLDPRRLMQVLHWPIRAMRIITDPIVDTLAYILLDCVMPSVLKVFRGFFLLVGFIAWSAIRVVLGNNIATNIANTSSKIVCSYLLIMIVSKLTNLTYLDVARRLYEHDRQHHPICYSLHHLSTDTDCPAGHSTHK